MRKALFILAGAALVMASCSENESFKDFGKVAGVGSPISFTSYVNMTRGLEVTTANLATFQAVALRADNETQVFYQATTYSSSDAAVWKSSPEYLWPNYNLNFYCYNNVISGDGSAFTQTISSDKKIKITPATAIKDQADFVAAIAQNQGPAEKTNLTFTHALSRISVEAKNSNANYVIKISAVKLANLDNQGTFTFVSGDATLQMAQDGAHKNNASSVDYTVSGTAKELNDSYQRLMFADNNGAEIDWYLIPQTFTANTIDDVTHMMASADATYVALKGSIVTKDNAKVYPIGVDTEGWIAVPLANAVFEQGKEYTIKLNFFSEEGGGAGYSDPEAGEEPMGKPIIDPTNKYIRFSAEVSPWAQNVDFVYNL